MSQLIIPFLADGTPATITIDGVTYRVARVDGQGRQLVTLDRAGDDPRTVNAQYAAAQTDTIVIAAPGAGSRLYLCWVKFSCDLAGTFFLHEGAAGATRRWGTDYFQADTGEFSGPLSPPVQFGDNTPLRITSTVAGNHSLDIGVKVAP